MMKVLYLNLIDLKYLTLNFTKFRVTNFLEKINVWRRCTVSRSHTKGRSKIFFGVFLTLYFLVCFWHFMVRNVFFSVQRDSTPKISIKCRVREKFNIQIPQSRIDELLFQEATTKISAPNSKYNCFFAQ
jgi:hypothetical protein